MTMNLDLQWLQNHIGAMATEIAALKGALNAEAQHNEAMRIEIASLKDRLGDEEPKSGPQLVAGD